MTIFLTGATGYIGSVVAEALARAGYDVVGLARSDKAAQALASKGYRVHEGDLTDPASLAEAARAADATIHMAVTGGGDVARTDQRAVDAMLGVLSSETEAPYTKPFVYTSGVWVLGDTGSAVAGEGALTDAAEIAAWRPALEEKVLSASGSVPNSVRGIVIRPALAYGRGGGIPAMLVASGRERGAVHIAGSGEQRWPFVHVEDLADLYVHALDAPGGTLLHAASGSSYRAADVARAASHAAGVPGRTETWPLEEARAEWGALADALALDQQVSARVARESLGWRPEAPSVLDDLRHGSYAGSPFAEGAPAERTSFICETCGVQQTTTDGPPERCPVCEDERQYVGRGGQTWTTPARLRREHRNEVRALEPGLVSIHTEPHFAIGQRALLVQTPEGNVLWDCLSLLDNETRAAVESLGGVTAIAISHPHYYGAMAEWSRAFDAPVYLHARDRAWVMRAPERLRLWEGDRQALAGGLTLVRTGGHFAGASVLHWPGGAGGRGTLLSADAIQVGPGRRSVGFMRSYPNEIPLAAADVSAIVRSVEGLAFDRIYGAWPGRQIRTGAEEALCRSAERYREALDGVYGPDAPARP